MKKADEAIQPTQEVSKHEANRVLSQSGSAACSACDYCDEVKFHKARMRAFFEGAEFENIDKLMSGTVADFAKVGRVVAQRTKDAIKEARENAVLAHWSAIKHLFADMRD